MKGLIQKSGYIKPGSGGGHYAEYIATRDGVELMEPTAGGGYLEYIAERPRSHGLFSADGAADLEQTMKEINTHAGPVWTFIYSLKREDAARLGYENGESWRRLLLAHQTELAAAMKIPPSSFRWCAAFHDEKHHPHIHMMAWSADPKQGYLTEKGIEQMRSQLSNDIFQDELLSLYQEKDLSYQEVRDAAMEAMGRLIREMKSGLCDSPVIAGQMETLAKMLSEVKGKKVYGYLKKPVKAQADTIVDELAKLPEVADQKQDAADAELPAHGYPDSRKAEVRRKQCSCGYTHAPHAGQIEYAEHESVPGSAHGSGCGYGYRKQRLCKCFYAQHMYSQLLDCRIGSEYAKDQGRQQEHESGSDGHEEDGQPHREPGKFPRLITVPGSKALAHQGGGG